MLRLRSWLNQLDPNAGIGGVEISVEVTGDRGMQPHLWQTRRKEEPDLHSLAKALEQRFGRQPLKKAAPLDPDALLPENRFKLIDVA